MAFGFLSTGELYALVCAIVWAIAIILFRIGGRQVSPLVLSLFKSSVGLVLFLITLPLLSVAYFPSHATTRDWVVIAASGVLGVGLADALFFASLNRLGATSTAILDSLYSPLVVVAAFLYLSEPISWKILISMLLMALAVILGTSQSAGAAGPKASSNADPKANSAANPEATATVRETASRNARRNTLLVGIALGLGGLALMAVSIVILKPVLAHHSAWWVASARLVAGLCVLALLVSPRRYRRELVSTLRPSKLWKVLLPAGVIGCYLTMITWILGIQLSLASVASILNQSSTVIVLVLAAVFLHETLTLRKAFAVALAFGGVVLASL